MADIVPPPPPPMFDSPKQGWVRRTWAIVGIIGGLLSLIVPGVFAIRSYRRWRSGTIRRPIFAWTFAWITVAYVVLGVIAYIALPNELINVDFREGVEPFEINENSTAKSAHVEGTYRLTVKNANESITSLGEFVRTAYAVGIRAEVVEITEPGTTVGASCLGPAPEGMEGLTGYGFFVEPGGHFILGREDPGGRIEFLERGTDTRIETVERVSIICAPGLGGDVSLIGFANGIKIISAEDPDGYRAYTYAGLFVLSERAGTEVRFTRVWARVPDEEWIP